MDNLKQLLKTLKPRKAIKKQLKTTSGRIYFRLDASQINKRFDVTEIIADKKSRKMILSLKEDGTRAVSFRKDNGQLKGLIDLKDSKTKNLFKDCSVSISIYEDFIVVEGVSLSTEKLVKSNHTLCLDEFKNNRQANNQLLINRSDLDHLVMKKVSGGDSCSDQLSFLTADHCSNFSKPIQATFDNAISSRLIQKGLEDGLKVATLFSGMGGLDLAFKQEGYNLIFALDKGFHKETSTNKSLYGASECSEVGIDHIKTYKHNLGNHIVDADFLTYPTENFPEADVYVAGIPCVELSSVSPNRNNFQMLPGFIDKFIEVIKKAKQSCKVFVIENSNNLVTAGRQFLQKIKSELPWFKITENVVDAADFGSAQHRKRAIIIGSTVGEISLRPPTIVPLRTVRTAFEGLSDSTPNQNPSLYCSIPRKETVERMKHVPQGGNWENIPKELQTKGKFANYHRRLSFDEKSIAIVNIRKSIVTHPLHHRGLSVRECLRLFDFPDSFVCKGSLSAMQQMVCNSVPLTLGKAIAKTIKPFLLKPNSKPSFFAFFNVSTI